MRKVTVFYLFIVGFIGVLLIWIGYARIADFRASQIAIANESTSSIAHSITHFISERRRLVTVFTHFKQEILRKVIQSPDNDLFHEELVQSLRIFFPNYFAYSLIDPDGNPLFDDFDGLVGQQCIEDIKQFSRTGFHYPKIHPNSEMYHFDIMVPFEDNQKKYTFFLSFNSDLLAEILHQYSMPNHEALLTIPVKDRTLIEVTQNGTRIHLDRDDYRLNEDETQRVLIRKQITGTSWQVMDLHSPGLFNSYNREIYLHASIVFGLFLIISTLWYRHENNIEKLQRESEKQRSEFLSTVSHELRTPLTAIKGSVGLIAGNINGDLTDKTKKLSDLALQNTDRLIGIVNDLLDIQKIESGKLKLTLTEENLSLLVRQAVDSINDYGTQFNVNYQVTDLLPDTIVKTDANRFIQIMHNLLSNATKYGDNNDTVEIFIIKYNKKVRVSVSDNGAGVPEEIQDKLFSKFVQASGKKAENQKVNSTGLGLHIVKQLVHSMNGEINYFTSELGTTFYIDLNIEKRL